MNLALITRWKRIFITGPGVPFPCRAWENWENSKNKICDCGSICKIPYKSNEEITKVIKGGKTYYIIKHK